LGGNAESGEPHVPSVVDEHIRRLDIFMYKAAPMDLADCFSQTDGDAQKARQFERLPVVPLKNPIQGFTARVIQYEDCPAFVMSKGQRLGRPRGIEFGSERIFMLEPPEILR
jgi:hypothetical protein